MNVTFCAGSGRCGTTTIAAQLAQEGIESRHEGVPWIGDRFDLYSGTRLARPGAKRKIRFMNMIQWIPEEGAFQGSLWNEDAVIQRRKWLENNEVEDYFEASHYFSGNLNLLYRHFPKMKIIHLWRPALEVVESFIRKVEQPIYRSEGKHKRTNGSWRGWYDVFPLFPDVTTRAEGYAAYWEWTNQMISEFHHQHPEVPYKLVHISELNGPSWDDVAGFVLPDRTRTGVYPSEVRNKRPANRERGPSEEMKLAVSKLCSWSACDRKADLKPER